VELIEVAKGATLEGGGVGGAALGDHALPRKGAAALVPASTLNQGVHPRTPAETVAWDPGLYIP
jgi:hypothetical protein